MITWCDVVNTAIRYEKVRRDGDFHRLEEFHELKEAAEAYAGRGPGPRTPLLRVIRDARQEAREELWRNG